MNEINEQLKGISELITRIDAKILEISTKLDELIAALHEYDDENIYKGYDEPNTALLKAAGLYNEELNKEYGESSFEAFQDETELNKRMDIIGQNGNEGSHYIDINGNEFSDYGQRIAKEVMSDENNIRVDKDKSNNIQPKQKQYWKNNRSKRNDNKK